MTAMRLLAGELSGADATSLLLAAMASRAEIRTSAAVLAQYQRDRFVAPAEVDPTELARLRLRAFEILGRQFLPVETSPIAPLGSHSVLAGVHQNNVVSTIRMTEVAADPTNQLALEAALERKRLLDRDSRSAELVSLCAVDRVVRAQMFDGGRSLAHFSLLGLVVGGRDLGHRRFEADALVSVLFGLSEFVTDVVAGTVQIQLTDFDGRFRDVLSEVSDRVTTDRVVCGVDLERSAGRGYYPNVCFKLLIDTGDETIEIGDGGSVEWTAALLQSRKERLIIGGLSLERLASL